MASPLNILRKYQTQVMVTLLLVAMFTFVVGPIIADYLSRGARGPNVDKTVVTWKGGKLSESGLYHIRQSHHRLLNFLSAVEAKARESNGSPKATPISRATSERDLVMRLLKARRAEDLGLVITDEMMVNYLILLSDKSVERTQFNAIMHEATGGQLDERTMFAQLRYELLAQKLDALTVGDWRDVQEKLFLGEQPLALPPAVAWDYFGRIHRRVRIEMYPLRTADFLYKVKDEPSEAQILKLYEEHKDKFEDPESAEPGFKRWNQVAFQYVTFNMKRFIDEEKAKVSEREIAEYYEKNKELSFVESELPEEPKKENDAEKKPAAEPGEETTPPAKTPADDKPEEKKPEDNKPESNEPGDKKPDDKKPAEANPEEGEPEKDRPEAKELEKKEPAPEECQDEEPKAPAKPGEAPAAEPAQQGEPADKEAPVEKEGEPEKKPADTKDPPAANETKKEPAGDEKPAGEEKPASEKAPPKKKEVKYKPLDDKLKEEIRRQLAMPRATERKTKAIKEVQDQLREYSRELRRWEAEHKADLKDIGPKPEPVDLKKLARSLGIQSGQTPLLDPLAMAEDGKRENPKYELSQARIFDRSSFRTFSFSQLAFQPGAPLFEAYEIDSGAPAAAGEDVSFLFWRIEEKPAYVPSLKEARAAVVDAWKRQEAFRHAQEAAQKLASEVSQSGNSIRETLPAQEAGAVFETDAFSWLSRNTPFGGGQHGISRIRKIGAEFNDEAVEAVGDEFMEAVFSLRLGETGVAVNAPHTVVCVVRIIDEPLSEELLLQMFLDSPNKTDIYMLALRDRGRQIGEWQDELEKEMGLKWLRDPDSQDDG